ncbi:solute carrier family 35 member F1 [Arapaima gigas]
MTEEAVSSWSQNIVALIFCVVFSLQKVSGAVTVALCHNPVISPFATLLSRHCRYPGPAPTLTTPPVLCTNRELLLTLALGQVLSLLICGIGLTSKYLADDFHANTPVFQSFLNYILLFLVYTTTLAVRQGMCTPAHLLPWGRTGMGGHVMMLLFHRVPIQQPDCYIFALPTYIQFD